MRFFTYIQLFVAFLLISTGLLFVGEQSLLAQEPIHGSVHDYSAVKEYEIGGIQVVGTKYLDENILISFSELRVGDRITLPGDEIPDAIKKLWKQGLFADVQIYASRIVNDEIIFLEIHLKELPRLTRYRFEGARNPEVDELRENLSLLTGRILDENTKNNIIIQTKDYYVNRGFLLAKVDLEETVDTLRPNSVLLKINVNRGNKIKINDIKFEGVEGVYTRKLKKTMESTKGKTMINPETPKLIAKDLKGKGLIHTLANVSIADALNYFDDKVRIRLFSQSKFEKDDFEDDQESMIAYYNTQGFRDAQIVKDSVVFIDDKNIDIHMKVEEGRKYYFRDFTWTGNSKYTSDTLATILGIEPGTVYNPQLLEARVYGDPSGRDISSLYMNQGHLFFNVNPIETRIDGDSIDMEMRVYEGPEATINRIIIKGNTKTNEHVIRRSLYTKPGNKFRRSDLIRSQQELVALNYFNPQSMGVRPIPNPQDGTVDIEYTVEERPSDQLELSAGWGGNTVVGTLGISFNNFSVKNMFDGDAWRKRGIPSGDGQQLSVRFQSSGPTYQALSASFTEPWLGGKRRNSFTLAVSRIRQAILPRSGFTLDFTAEPTNLLVNNTVAVSLGRRLRWPDDYFTLSNTLKYSHFKLDDWDQRFVVTNGDYYAISLNTTLTRSSVLDPIFPRSGSTFQVSAELTPPYSLLNNKDYTKLNNQEKFRLTEYHKWKFKAEWYTELVNKLVLRISTKGGILGRYTESIGTSPFERFWVGGDGLSNQVGGFLAGTDIFALRGYNDNEITQNVAIREDGAQVSVGDPYMQKFSAELRYLLSPNPSATIYVMGFVEAGNSWNNFQDYNPFEMRRAAGLGLRIYLPMFGLMGFNYGVGFDKNGFANDGKLGTYLSNYGVFSFVLGFEPE